MTHTFKSTASALAVIGLVSLAPLSAEARGLQGHFPETENSVNRSGGYAEQSVTRARTKQSGTILRSFNGTPTFGQRAGKTLFGISTKSRPSLSESQRQRRDSVNSFNR